MGNKHSKITLDSIIKNAILSVHDTEIMRLIDQFPFMANRPLDDRLWTPLIFACICLKLDKVMLLVQRYLVDINWQDYDGCTALHHLVMIGENNQSIAIIHYLCSVGARTDLKTNTGITAKQLANLNKHVNLEHILTYYEKHGLYAQLTWHNIKKLLFIRKNKDLYRKLPMCIIRHITEYM